MGIRGMRKEQYPLEVDVKEMESQESLSQRFGKETVVGGEHGWLVPQKNPHQAVEAVVCPRLITLFTCPVLSPLR